MQIYEKNSGCHKQCSGNHQRFADFTRFLLFKWGEGTNWGWWLVGDTVVYKCLLTILGRVIAFKIFYYICNNSYLCRDILRYE